MTAANLHSLISEDIRLARICRELSQTSREDSAHNLAHSLRVTLIALDLADDNLPAVEIIAAGLLHDVVNLPKNAPDRAAASELSARFAATLLRDCGFEDEAIERIAAAIRNHSYSRGTIPDDPLGKVLQDADRLDALGAIGIFRVVSTGDRLGSLYYDLTDPWASSRPLNDAAYTLDHFFVKLFRLPETMNTEAGRAEALRRVAFMQAFLVEFGREIGFELAGRTPDPMIDSGSHDVPHPSLRGAGKASKMSTDASPIA